MRTREAQLLADSSQVSSSSCMKSATKNLKLTTIMSMAKSLVMDLTSTAILKTISSSIREDQKTVAAIEAFKIIMMTVAESQAAVIRRAMTNLVANAQTVIAVEAKAEAAADPTKMTQEAMDPDYLTAIEINILSMIDVYSVTSLCVKLFDIDRGSLFIINLDISIFLFIILN